MAIEALHFATISRNPHGVPKYEYLVATFLPLWSGLAYIAIALAQGKVAVTGQITHYARYLGWMITTLHSLLSLSWTAMQFIPKDKTLIDSRMGTEPEPLLDLSFDLSSKS